VTKSSKASESETVGDAPDTEPPATDDTLVEAATTDAPETQQESAEPPELDEGTADSHVEPKAPAVPKRRGGFLGPVAGGIIAAVIGFAAAQYMGPNGWPFGPPPPVDYSQKIADQAATTADLGQQVAKMNARLSKLSPVDVTPQLKALESRLGDKIATVSSRVSNLSTKLNAMDARLTELEKRPVTQAGGDISGAVAAYEKELEAMRNELAAQRARNDEMTAKVAAAAAAATAKIDAATRGADALQARAAMMRVMAALDAGGGFKSALDSLGITDIPDALIRVAKTGVPTLAALQNSFPDPARAALAASLKAQAGGSAGDRLTAFLRTQVGARSLTPREGNDPDAVLSRAQADLNTGDVAKALDELASLPDPGRKALADWRQNAQNRVDAVATAASLATRLNLN